MQKYLIFGATGSVGSNLATQLSQANKEIHLIGRNEAELEKLSAELGCDYTVLDILSDDIDQPFATLPIYPLVAVISPVRYTLSDHSP